MSIYIYIYISICISICICLYSIPERRSCPGGSGPGPAELASDALAI